MSEERATSLSERVADILAERIQAGVVLPGARIKQDELADELKISRIPVRDALRILEARGLVTMRANTGARVASLSLKDLEMSCEIRERLEPMLLADSIPNLTDGDIKELYGVMTLLAETKVVCDAIKLSRQFHFIMYSRNTSPLLAQIVDRLHDATESYRRAYGAEVASSGAPATMKTVHWLLYDAIAQCEVEAAQAALIMHIRRVKASLAHYFNARGDGAAPDGEDTR